MKLSWPVSMKYIHLNLKSATETTSTADGAAPELTPIDDDTASSSRVSCPSIKQALTHGVLKEPDHIRLLRISPGSREAALHGTLRVVGLQSRPDYEALSYTWADDHGDSSRSRRMYIGPFWDIIHITANCERALTCLRSTTTPRTFWVDSICIDQDSDRERSHQVGMMSRIYSYASRVTAYLGPRTRSSDTAMEVFRRGDNSLLLGAKDAFKFSSSESEDLRDLFNRCYFSRLWIVQEISLAKALVFRCDDHSFYHPDLKRILPMLQESVLPRWLQHSMTPSMGGRTLVELVTALAGSHCSDPRDHIFGLLGLCDVKSALSDGLVPDYSLSEVEVFTGFAAYAVLNTTIEDVLQLAIRSQPTTIPLPSWVPNWAQTFHPEIWRSPGDYSIALKILYRIAAQTPVSPSVKEQRAFSGTTVNGALAVVGDWLVRDADFVDVDNTLGVPDTNTISLHKAGCGPGCSMTLRVTMSRRVGAGPDLARSPLNVFRVRGNRSVLVLRTRPGSAQQEFLGVGQLYLEAQPSFGPWKFYRCYEAALSLVRLGSKSKGTTRSEWRETDQRSPSPPGRADTLAEVLKEQVESSLASIWRFASPIYSRDSGSSLLNSVWEQASRTRQLDDKYLQDVEDWVSKEMEQDIRSARSDWTRLQELVASLGGTPPTERCVSSLVAELEACRSLPGFDTSLHFHLHNDWAKVLAVRAAATEVSLWYSLTAKLLETCAPINPDRDFYFWRLRGMMKKREAGKIWQYLPTPSVPNPKFAAECSQRLQDLSLEGHLTVLREILRHRAGKPGSGTKGVSEQESGSEPLMAGYWDWEVLASQIEKAIAYWEGCGAFWEQLQEVVQRVVQLDFLDEGTRREMQHELGLSVAWDQTIFIN